MLHWARFRARSKSRDPLLMISKAQTNEMDTEALSKALDSRILIYMLIQVFFRLTTMTLPHS
jgi:hypothetical protein